MRQSMFIYEVDKARKVATVTFNSPEHLNAMTPRDARELADLFEAVSRDDNVKVLIMKGAGRAFCSGARVDKFLTAYGLTSEEGEPIYGRTSQSKKLIADDLETFGLRGLHQAEITCAKATIAQVHGFCYGTGFHIAINADITIAAEGTMFTHPGFRLMGPSAQGLIAPLILNAGLKRAVALMFTGRPFEAKEAKQLGIVTEVVPLDKLEAEVQRYAETITLLSMDGIVCGKYAIGVTLERLACLGMTPVVLHNLGTNIKWDPGDFNWLKEKRDRGTSRAIRERERRYAHLGMDLESAKKAAGVE